MRFLPLALLVAFAPLTPAEEPQKVSAAAPVSNDDARHYELTIKQILPKGALVDGGWHDWTPGTVIPAGKVTIRGITMPAVQTQWRGDLGTVFVFGLGEGKVDGDEWQGMLEPAGTFNYRGHAFKLSPAADPVADYWRRTKAAK